MSFKQKSLRLVFKLWANHIRTFDSKFLGTVLQNCDYLSIATSSWRTNSLKKGFLFTILFCFSAELLQDFGENFTAELTKVHLLCPKEQLMENKLFEKNRPYSKTTDFQRLAIEIWQKASTELPKLHIICQINHLRKNIFWAEVYLQKFFRTASEKFWLEFWNLFRCFQRKFFTEKTFLFKKSCLFPVNAEISSRYLVETFWQDVQNCISIVQRSMIPGRNCFFENVDFFSISDLEQIFFESSAATFRQLRENCNPSFHRNILKKKRSVFDRYQIFTFTNFNRCNFEQSKKLFLSALSIRHSTYPEERLDEISFLQRNGIVLPFVDFEWKIS